MTILKVRYTHVLQALSL